MFESKRHPLTGELIEPLWIRPDGRVCWPIMGAADDDGRGGGTGGDGGSGDGDKGGQSGSGDDGKGGGSGSGDGGDGGDKGYPTDKPVAEMTAAEQAAYWKDNARKHETRAREYREAAGGKTADEVRSGLKEADELRKSRMSDEEKARETAKVEGARTGSLSAVKATLDIALGDMSDEDKASRLELLDLSKFLTESGEVDTAKVRTFAKQNAPKKDDDDKRRRDFGGGPRGDTRPKGGIAAVMADRRAAREGKAS